MQNYSSIQSQENSLVSLQKSEGRTLLRRFLLIFGLRCSKRWDTSSYQTKTHNVKLLAATIINTFYVLVLTIVKVIAISVYYRSLFFFVWLCVDCGDMQLPAVSSPGSISNTLTRGCVLVCVCVLLCVWGGNKGKGQSLSFLSCRACVCVWAFRKGAHSLVTIMDA